MPNSGDATIHPAGYIKVNEAGCPEDKGIGLGRPPCALATSAGFFLPSAKKARGGHDRRLRNSRFHAALGAGEGTRATVKDLSLWGLSLFRGCSALICRSTGLGGRSPLSQHAPGSLDWPENAGIHPSGRARQAAPGDSPYPRA